jgi:hypothetical protein
MHSSVVYGPVTFGSIQHSIQDFIVADDGSIYAVVPTLYRIMRIANPTAASPTASVFAGTGSSGQPGHGDGGPATSSNLCGPQSLAIGPDGSVFFTDVEGFTISGGTTSGTRIRIRKIATDGTLSTVAFTGETRFADQKYPDREGTLASDIAVYGAMNSSVGLEIDSDGNIFFRFNGEVWRISAADGTVYTAVMAFTGNAQINKKSFPLSSARVSSGAVSLDRSRGAPYGILFVLDDQTETGGKVRVLALSKTGL